MYGNFGKQEGVEEVIAKELRKEIMATVVEVVEVVFYI